MGITGTVFENQEKNIASIEVEVTELCQFVSVIINGATVIKFPLAKAADTNTIALRTTNVINQTGLVNNSVRCEVIETV